MKLTLVAVRTGAILSGRVGRFVVSLVGRLVARLVGRLVLSVAVRTGTVLSVGVCTCCVLIAVSAIRIHDFLHSGAVGAISN